MSMEMSLMDENESLLITLINMKTLEYFQKAIDAVLIESNRDLGFLFESPKDMLLVVKNRFDEIVITNNGEIKLKI
jgi:hypothetical protein